MLKVSKKQSDPDIEDLTREYLMKGKA